MSLITWADSYKTNFEVIDMQHEHLFKLLNLLYDEAQKKHPVDIDTGLKELVAYALFHFQTEERLFEEYKYPLITSHKEEHQMLVRELSEIIQHLESGKQSDIYDLIHFLKDWLLIHTTGSDLEFAKYAIQHNSELNSREMRILALKEEVNRLARSQGLELPYMGSLNQETGAPVSREDTDKAPVNVLVVFKSLESYEPLKLMFKHFCESIGVAAAIIDTQGEILIQSKWQRICTDFHRINHGTCENCIESDTMLAGALGSGKRYSCYTCKNGLTDCASPIVINDMHIANVFIGQFHLEPPDTAFFIKQAHEYGFDQEAYVSAALEAPVINPERLDHLVGFLVNFTSVITQLLQEKINVTRLTKTLEKKIEVLNHQERIARSLAEDAEKAKLLVVKNQEAALEQARISAAHQESKNAEVKLRSVLTTVPDPVIAVNSNRRIEVVNRRFLEVVGLSNFNEMEINVEDMSLLQLASQVGNPSVQALLMSLDQQLQDVKENALCNFFYSVLLDDGSQQHLDYTINAVITDGIQTGYVVVFRDITDIRNAEIASQEARWLAEEATKSKSQFLANMSHEIRTPMNAVIGLNHLLARTELTQKQRDYVHKIGASAQGLLGIINDILDFSKIEAGKLTIENTPFDLDSVLDNVSNMVGLKTMEKGLELVFDIGLDVPMMLIGDPLRLGQILLNLVNNAVKFTPRGEIKISASLIKRLDDKAMISFSVRDTGIGMSKEQQNKLFQAFSQADTSTSRKFGGTGLGLTISKKLCELMGGDISLQSEEGVGSAFTFTANMGIQLNAKKKSDVIPKILKGLKVLVVDDNESARIVLLNYLNDFDFRVDAVSSGEQAIQQVCTHMHTKDPYRLVLMDWKMDGINGIQATKEILSLSAGFEQPKVVMVSGYGREELMSEARDAHIDAFLIKPVNQSLIFDTVIEVFGAQRFEDATNLTQQHKDKYPLDSIRGARILLVEDNEINQQVAIELLESEGFVVDVANDGQEAVDMYLAAKSNPYDIILMDLQMPVMDGITASRIILADPDSQRTPIVAMTADAMSGVEQQVLEVGLQGYVTKPIDLGDLFSTLMKWIKPGERKIEVNKERHDPLADVIVPHLDGIDQAEGIKRIGGNKVVYLKLLASFYKSHLDFREMLEKTLESGDINTAVRYVHTLKGVSGNIGAKSVFVIAQQVEGLLKKIEVQDSRLAIDNLTERYQLYEILDSLLDELNEKIILPSLNVGTTEKIHKDLAKIQQESAALKTALEAYDAVAMTHLEALRLAGAFIDKDEMFEKIHDYIDQYDFETALEAIAAL